jgi:hypothetical protein
MEEMGRKGKLSFSFGSCRRPGRARNGPTHRYQRKPAIRGCFVRLCQTPEAERIHHDAQLD